PHLLPEMRRRVQALQAMEPLLGMSPAAAVPDALAETLTGQPVSRQRGIPSTAATGNTSQPAEEASPRQLTTPLQVIADYEVISELGRGGMGVVYLARQVSLGRQVALKMILAPYSNEEQRRRFRTEAEAIARLQHPNIVAVYEIGEHEGKPYFSLEFCAG